MRSALSKLGPFSYTIHNMIAHPIMEILHLLGLGAWGDKLHDLTLPLSHDEEHQHNEESASSHK